jgi:hypothetical protein
MSSRGKKKTTMAKLNREARLRERRLVKAERKDARKDAALNGTLSDFSDAPLVGVEYGPLRADDSL